MDHGHIRDMDSRLATLERQCRTARWGVSIAVACVLLILYFWNGAPGETSLHAGELPASAPLSIVRAGAFELVDAHGDVRARLFLREGTPCLSFLDPNGAEQLTLGPDNALRVLDTRTHCEVELGQGGLVFRRPDGRAGSSFTWNGMRVQGDAEAHTTLDPFSIRFWGTDGKEKTSLSTRNGLRLYEADGRERASLQARNGLRLYGDTDDTEISLQPWHGIDLRGAGRGNAATLNIKIVDAEGHTRVRLGHDLVIRDATGQTVRTSGAD